MSTFGEWVAMNWKKRVVRRSGGITINTAAGLVPNRYWIVIIFDGVLFSLGKFKFPGADE